MSKKGKGSMKELTEEWETFEPLIREDLGRLKHRIKSMYSGMATAGVSEAMREPFVYEQICRMIREITGPEEVKDKSA